MPGVSDHHLVYTAYAVSKPKYIPKIIYRRDSKNFLLENFRSDADATHWENVYFVDTLDDKVCVLENNILNLMDKHFPVREIRVTHRPAPWLNANINTLRNKRDKLKIKYNKCRNPAVHINYKQTKNQITSLSRKAKLQYFDSAINCIVGNTKEYWAALKRLQVVDSECDTGVICSAEDLNSTFVSNNNDFVDPDFVASEVASILETTVLSTFNFSMVSEVDVIKALRSISTNASGVDGISAKFIKLCIPYVAPVLTHIVNCSLESGIFPSRWKFATVKPIKKCLNPLSPSDYRPISILPAMSKVLEKLVCSQIVKYLNLNNLMDCYQSGFRSQHSTATALLKVTDDLFQGIDESKISLLVLIDYSKAFDRVNHNILLAKMESLGISNSAIHWFTSYLSNRTQRVVVDSDSSSWITLANGVPQGSILGPLLFTILVSDIHKYISSGKHHMYADDVQVYHQTTVENLPETISSVNENLIQISKFSSNNLLKINPNKSNFIIVGSHRSMSKVNQIYLPPIYLDGTPIERLHFARNLGITFDEVLSWRRHISVTIGKAYASLKMLSRFKKFLSFKSKKLLCNAIVLSHFNYCDVLFSNINLNL